MIEKTQYSIQTFLKTDGWANVFRSQAEEPLTRENIWFLWRKVKRSPVSPRASYLGRFLIVLENTLGGRENSIREC